MFKSITHGEEKKLPINIRDPFTRLGMIQELNHLQNSSRTSAIVTTANKEFFKDLLHFPFLILMCLTPWRLF